MADTYVTDDHVTPARAPDVGGTGDGAAVQPGWWADLVAAARDLAAICPGMALLGITFGLVVVHAGLAWWWTPLFSGLIFGGSLEFLLVAMVVTAAPLTAVAVTSLLVQGRHVFYALSFPLHRIRSRAGRAYAVFALIDEAYALTAARPAVEQFTGRRIITMQALMHASWVGGGIAGAVVGERPQIHVPALDFVFVALFVVLAVESIASGAGVSDPLLALGCALAARLVAPGQVLLVAMAGYCLLLLAARPLRERASRGEGPRVRSRFARALWRAVVGDADV